MNNKSFYLLMRGIGRFFKDFKPNIISLVTLCTLIFVYHIFYALGDGASSFLSHVSEVQSVRAYLQTDASQNNTEISAKILKIKGVDKATYFSPADAKAYVAENAPNMGGMKSFAEEFFPAFIEITPTDRRDQKSLDLIVAETAKIQGIENVSYGKDIMMKFLNVGRGATTFIVIISILFTISTAFVLYNTVKLSLYKFREEIKLYSLVGATRSFISVPFIVSTILTGCFAFIAGSALFYFGLAFFNGKILLPAGINILTSPTLAYFVYFFVCVCLVSLFAASTSIKSFLSKVSSVNDD